MTMPLARKPLTSSYPSTIVQITPARSNCTIEVLNAVAPPNAVPRFWLIIGVSGVVVRLVSVAQDVAGAIDDTANESSEAADAIPPAQVLAALSVTPRKGLCPVPNGSYPVFIVV